MDEVKDIFDHHFIYFKVMDCTYLFLSLDHYLEEIYSLYDQYKNDYRGESFSEYLTKKEIAHHVI